MKNKIFIDTSGFYALLVQSDETHVKAKNILDKAAQIKQRFVTTDYILDETATLLRARGLTHLVTPIFDIVLNSKACSVVWMDEELFSRVKTFYLKHSDHPWSFTDCSSFVVMKEMGLTQALTKDRHFKEAGFLPLLM